MATYPPVRPAPGSWFAIPASDVDTDIAATGGDMWISDDATPSIETAFPLPLGKTYPVKAGRALQCTPQGSVGCIRRMDRPE